MSPLSILAVSLFVIPLCGPIIIEPFIAVRDLWTTKEFLVLMAILAIVAVNYHRRPVNSPDENIGHSNIKSPAPVNYHRRPVNSPFIALLLFLPVSTFAAPPLELIYGHENMAGLWIWRSLAWCFAYFLLYRALCGQDVQEGHKTAITRAIGWAAIVSAGYAYLQALGVDQWQISRPMSEIGQPAAVNITAMIGNPTYLAVWMVMCLPFLRGWWILFVVGAVVLCKSDIALAGVVLEAVIWTCLRAKSTLWLKAVLGAGLAACVIVAVNWAEIRPHLTDNGRFAVWAQTFEDWKAPCIKLAITDDMSSAQKQEIQKLNKRTYSLTGRGLGSFPYIFSPKFGTNYESAHNEYLEGLYSIGLIGLALFMAAIGWVFWHTFTIARADPFCMALYTSLFFCCFAAFGLPTLHVEPLRFYSAVMFCLLSSMIQRKNNC